MRTAVSLVLMAAVPEFLLAQTTSRELPWTHAESVAVVAERRIRLRAVAWRDFMPRPGGMASGSDLMVNLQIQALGDLSLPPGLTVDSAWVRCAEGQWSAAPSREPRPELANGLDLILRGGPRWSTDQAIDVLVRLRLPSAEERYVQARDQPINRTD